MSQREEKRRHPRVERRLQVESHLREALQLETIDLSAGGLRVTSPHFIPPMTKMELSMVLPFPAGSPAENRRTVRGEAVVVRTEPPAPGGTANGGYRVALFFSRMEDEDRQALQNYLKDRSGK